MVAIGATPFALGSDFAGSIRLPSLFCGIVGFWPTQERHSIRGLSWYTSSDGVFIKPFRPVIGPMGRWVDDVVDGWRALGSGKISDYDLSVPNVKFDEELYSNTLNKKLRIGVISNMNEICNSEKALKIFEIAKETLTNAGHEIIDIKFEPSLINFALNGLNILLNEAMPLILEEMGNSWDSLDSNLQIFLFMYNYLPRIVIKSLSKIAWLLAPRQVSDILSVWYPRNVDELAELLRERFNGIQSFTTKYHSLKLDGLLAPGFSDEAFKFEEVSI